MGSNQGTLNVSFGEKKKVVIVGGSFACIHLTNNLVGLDPKLSQFDITWVDKQAHHEYIPALYDAFVDDKEFEKDSISYDTIIKNLRQESIKFVQGLLVNVKGDENMIELNLDGKTIELPYDVLVIATGMGKSSPLEI